MLTWLGRRAARWVQHPPWTNVYGVGRSLIALAGALTFICNPSSVLFRPIAGGQVGPPFCSSALQKVSVFCVFPHAHMELVRWMSAAALLIVASGWRPRVTGLLHRWIAFGFQETASTLEGGDQAAAVLALLLLPVTLTDPRRWHWETLPEDTAPISTSGVMGRILAKTGVILIRIQVSAIYVHASTGKMTVTEWADGTAMYYWLTHPVFGASGVLAAILRPILTNPAPLAALTWGVILLELFLAMGLIATREARTWLLRAGFALHVGIWLFQGLATFSIVMFGALILYLRLADEPFDLAGVRSWVDRLRGGWYQLEFSPGRRSPVMKRRRVRE